MKIMIIDIKFQGNKDNLNKIEICSAYLKMVIIIGLFKLKSKNDFQQIIQIPSMGS